MNVLVLGAAGKTGALVVNRAVAAGHSVTAFVRDPDGYKAPESVRVASGSATDPAAIGAAMAGQSAVIDTIGGKTPWKATTLEADVGRAVVAAMKQAGARRLIVASAIGVGDSVGQCGFLLRHVILRTFLRGSTRDKAAMEQVVRGSGLDFVIVRPAVLTDAAAIGSVRVFKGAEIARKVTRADTAQFLVDQLQSDVHLGQAVTIANA
jgi:uncharacterized protein YbjT (DUF2867 family)